MDNAQALEKYWEKKLHIKYEDEFEYYRKLCGYKYNKKIIHSRYADETRILPYKEWEQMVQYQIIRLDIEELKEYSQYLSYRMRYYDDKFSLVQSLFIPMVIAFIVFSIDIYKEMINPINDFIHILIWNVILISVDWFLIGLIMYRLFAFIMEPIHKHFYEDMKKIVDERINEMETSEDLAV